MTFIPGSTGKLAWSFTDAIKRFRIRSWIFTPSDGQPQVDLARIIDDGDAEIFTTSYEVAVEKPATLVLQNVNLTYDGTYRFSLFPGGSSEVVVFIAGKLLIIFLNRFFKSVQEKFNFLIDWCAGKIDCRSSCLI